MDSPKCSCYVLFVAAANSRRNIESAMRFYIGFDSKAYTVIAGLDGRSWTICQYPVVELPKVKHYIHIGAWRDGPAALL